MQEHNGFSTEQATAHKFLDIFVVINNNALMPEVFTMVVNDLGEKPRYPHDIDYPALPIAGLPDIVRPKAPVTEEFSLPQPQTGYLAPAIFYLEDGIMLFFRVPFTESLINPLFCDNYFGPQDLMGNGGVDLPPFFF